MLRGKANDELAQEVKIYFGCYFVVNALVDIVVLVRGLVLPSLKVLVKLAAVLKEKVECLLNWVIDDWNAGVTSRHLSVPGLFPDEHIFKNIYDLDFKFRVSYFLIDGEK